MSLRRTPGRYAVSGLAACALSAVVLLPGNGADTALTAGPTTFSITGSVRDAPLGGFPGARCGPKPAALFPGVVRCLAVRVDNELSTSIVVRHIAVQLDPDHPLPPVGRREPELVLPEFSGALTVPAGGSARAAPLPIALRDTGFDQDACKSTTLHLRYAGLADRPAGEPPGHPGIRLLPFTGTDGLRSLLLGVFLVLAGWLVVSRSRDRRARAESSEDST